MSTERWAEEMWLYAGQLFEQNEVTQAKEVLENIVTEVPDYGRAHSYLGWYYYAKVNDYATAMRHLDLAIKFAPNYSVGYVHLINVLWERRMFGRLIEVAEAGHKADGSDQEWLWNMKGLALEMLNQFKEAKAAYFKAIEISTSDESIKVYRANVERTRMKERSRRGIFASLFL